MYKSTTGTGRSFEVGKILPSLELETNLNLPDAVGLWGHWWDVWALGWRWGWAVQASGIPDSVATAW